LLNVQLSDEQAGYLADVLDWWLEDYDAATNDVIQDRAIQDPEEMLRAVQGMHRIFALATEVKELLSGRASPVPTL
jgi:hypothetical protein